MQQQHPFQRIKESKYRGKCMRCFCELPPGSDYGRIKFSYGVLNDKRRLGKIHECWKLDNRRGILCAECQDHLGKSYYQYYKGER